MAKRDNAQMPLGLRRTIGYRILLGIAAIPALLIAITGIVGFNRFVGPVNGVAGPLVKLLVGEFFLALLVVSILSLLWSIIAPQWICNLLATHTLVLQIAIYIFIPALFAVLIVLGL